jgi:hypothetical protein
VLRLGAVALLGLAACSFDGGGLAADDGANLDAAGDDAPDARPGVDGAPPDAEIAIDGPPPTVAGVLHAEDAPAVVTLDGERGEFDAAGAATIAWNIQDGANYGTTHASYTASARVELQALHDTSNLYFFVRVDDAIEAIDSGTDIWDDDSVRIYLDVANDGLGPFAADDHEIVIRADGMWADYGPVGTSAELTGVAVAETGGYTLELRITKSSLSAPVGSTLGFDVLLVDDDGWGNMSLDGYSAWFVAPPPHCAACCTQETTAQPWCDTSTFGSLVLD